jgi:hypothetical protein
VCECVSVYVWAHAFQGRVAGNCSYNCSYSWWCLKRHICIHLSLFGKSFRFCFPLIIIVLCMK